MWGCGFRHSWLHVKSSMDKCFELSFTVTVSCWFQAFRKMLAKVMQYTPPDSAGVDCVNVLLMGGTGSGKSAFISSIDSVFQGRISRQGRLILLRVYKTWAVHSWLSNVILISLPISGHTSWRHFRSRFSKSIVQFADNWSERLKACRMLHCFRWLKLAFRRKINWCPWVPIFNSWICIGINLSLRSQVFCWLADWFWEH